MEKYHGERTDIRDFCHDNSPYMSDYVRPKNVELPELNSLSKPSDDENVNRVVEDQAVNADPEAAIEGINEFETNADVVQGTDLQVFAEDFETFDRSLRSPDVQPDVGNVASERKDKEPVKESYIPPNVYIHNLSDDSDSYSDLVGIDYGGLHTSEAGPSGAKSVDDTAQEIDPEMNAPNPTLPSAIPLRLVKLEKNPIDFWGERNRERERTRILELEVRELKRKEEEARALEEENRELKRILAESKAASHSQISRDQSSVGPGDYLRGGDNPPPLPPTSPEETNAPLPSICEDDASALEPTAFDHAVNTSLPSSGNDASAGHVSQTQPDLLEEMNCTSNAPEDT